MSIDEQSIYEVTGGDYSVYCLGYTEARQRAKEAMELDPWGAIPFVLKKPLELSLDTSGRVVLTKAALGELLALASDDLPVATE